MEDITKEQIEEMLKNVKANYKYTKLTDEFIRTIFGSKNDCYRLFMENMGPMQQKTISPTKDHKVFLMVGSEYYVLASDFEITTLKDYVEPKLTTQWQDGMIKTLPLYDKVNNIDAKHYLADLRAYEFDKMANRVNSLCDMLAIREAEEQN